MRFVHHFSVRLGGYDRAAPGTQGSMNSQEHFIFKSPPFLEKKSYDFSSIFSGH
jgi:hypothetical protein